MRRRNNVRRLARRYNLADKVGGCIFGMLGLALFGLLGLLIARGPQ